MGHKIRQTMLVGHKIRKLRKEHHLTQTELSSRIGIQQSDLSRMEKGEYRVSLDTLFKILGEFDLGIGEFFGEQPADGMDPRDAKLMRQFRTLSSEAQREVESFLDFKHKQLKEEKEDR